MTRADWLQQLPESIDACVNRWGLKLDTQYRKSSVSVVFPATTVAGLQAVLKLQFPHRESEHEAEALKCWDGNGAVRLLDSDPARHALLMERCDPGDPLSGIDHDAALEVLMELLQRLWVHAGPPFASLRDEAILWADELRTSWERTNQPFEKGLFEAALESLATLRDSQGTPVLLHQDLHGDNVLRAAREPWLVIDPKPLIGEREFSLSPIIRSRELGDTRQSMIARLDKLSKGLGLNRERARLWTFAQTLAWAFEGDRVLADHVEAARWLWHA